MACHTRLRVMACRVMSCIVACRSMCVNVDGLQVHGVPCRAVPCHATYVTVACRALVCIRALSLYRAVPCHFPCLLHVSKGREHPWFKLFIRVKYDYVRATNNRSSALKDLSLEYKLGEYVFYTNVGRSIEKVMKAFRHWGSF